MASRFKKVSDEEVNALKTAAENPNTKKVQLIGSEYLLIGAKKMGKKNIRRIIFLLSWINCWSGFSRLFVNL